MTANKNFKRRVRDRARRTGESYTAALRHLRQLDVKEPTVQWQRIEKTDFGYAISVPEGWTERPPDLKNSPLETARFGEETDRRHGVTVFRGPVRPGRTAAEIAELARPSLEHAGFVDFVVTDAEIGGRPGARLDCARHDAGRVWAVQEYFVTDGRVSFCLGCGTSMPDEDAALFAEIVARFEVLEVS